MQYAVQVLRFRIKTSEMFQVEDMVLFSHLVVTTVRLMRGSDTESRSVPVTVASVPPLFTNVQTRVTYSLSSLFYFNRASLLTEK